MKESTLQISVVGAEGTAKPKPQYINLITWYFKEKAHMAGEYTNNLEKVDEFEEVERAKRRCLNFIPNMMESHYRILSRWATWLIYIFKDYCGAAKWGLSSGRVRNVLKQVREFLQRNKRKMRVWLGLQCQ